MTKFITVTPKDSPKAHPWINVDHIITVYYDDHETHISLAHINTTLVVNETVEEVMKFINE
jgi:hypothetical protein